MPRSASKIELAGRPSEGTLKAAVVLRSVGMTYESMSGSIDALTDVSFTIDRGQFVSLIGPSGCGKSTILKIIAGLLPHRNGDVLAFGNPTTAGQREVGLMFQAPVLLPWRSVSQNVVLPFEIFGEPVDEGIKAKASHLLELVGLSGFDEKHPWELSGGMKQRVALARLLITEPSLLLLDEPLAALDELTRERLVFELAQICSRLDATALYVTHNITEALILSDRILVMSDHPGTILDDVSIKLERPRGIEVLDSDECVEAGRKVREILLGTNGSSGSG